MATKLAYRDGGKTSEEGINKMLSLYVDEDGVMGDDDLEPTEAGTPDNTVRVAIGGIQIGNDSPSASQPDYYYFGWVTSEESVTISANASGNDRIDAIVAYIDLTVVDDTDNDNPGALKFAAVEGTPAATPSAPNDTAIQSDIGASNPWVLIAHVDVANGFSSITDSDITDKRPKAGTLIRRLSDGFGDFVATGGLWTQDSGLAGTMTAIRAYIDGKCVNKPAMTKTFTASKDTYVDIPSTAKPTTNDDLTYTEVANDAAEPALASGSIRIAKVVTDGSGITSTVDLANRRGDSAASVYLAADQENLVDNTYTKVGISTEDYDIGSNFASNKFTAPYTGFYNVQYNNRFKSLVANKRYTSALYKNGSILLSFFGTNGDYAGYLDVGDSKKIFLYQGDYLELYARSGSGDNTVDLEGSVATHLTVSFDKSMRRTIS